MLNPLAMRKTVGRGRSLAVATPVSAVPINPLYRARARATLFGLCTALPLATLAACSTESRSDGDLAITPLYDQTTGHVVLQLSRALEGDERLLVRTRRGSFGTLDCGAADRSFSDVARTDDARLVGPAVDAKLLQPFYGPEWLHAEPTP